MEEDVGAPHYERPGVDGESLVESDATQNRQQHSAASHVVEKNASTVPVTQDTPANPFSRLPRIVIERILYLADACTFASLTLLNRKWRRISDSPSLYGHQLSQCPSFALSRKATEGDSTQTDNLALLKQQFFTEIRRNGFDVFFRPHQTLVKLISTSMSSSTAFPRGEAFRFVFSQNAQLILCISSSRIVVLDVASEPPAVKHEFKTLRRPLHATILDDGSLLAVVSSSHEVNIYSLSSAEAKLIQNLKLNDVPRTLALSPAGSVLAIAYNEMIEVYAVGESALVTERRAVRCAGVDSLSFSSDGVILLGSSDNHLTGNLVTITAPLYGEQETDFSVKDAQVQMWTTQILFPDIVQNYSYACLLPLHTEGEGSWILGFDNKLGTFRAIGASRSSSGTTYFASPMSQDTLQEHPPMMLASSDCEGELVALGFQDSGVWVYGLPDRLDIAPVAQNTSESLLRPCTAQSHSTDSGINLGRLQQSITRPKVLINGHKVTNICGITAAHWVRRNYSMGEQRRLAAVAPGGVDHTSFGEEDVPLDGGRILLLDFARSATNGKVTEFIIEIGESEPVLLREPNSSLDTEVELERRRTRLHRGSSAGVPGRGVRESYPAASSSARMRPRRNSSYLSASSSEVVEGEIPAIPDSPYDNTQPRSQDTLRRAATAAAANRRRVAREPRHVFLNNPVPPLFQIPHESDADNWVPPPPPYSREADAPLPDYLRRTLLPQPRRSGQNVAEAFRRSLSTRLSSDSSRSSLHRLNTVTGSNLASRVRRQMADSSISDSQRRPASFIRRREGSNPSQLLSSVNESTAPPQPQESLVSPHTVPNGTSHNPSPSTQIQPMTIPLPNNNQLVNSQHPMPAVPPTPPAMNNYLYSLSSPNLIPPDLIPESPETPIHDGNARQHDRTQSHDYRPPLSAAALRNRRASTDPTHSSAQSVAPEQQWRRRIEEWNERTIYERSKKHRSKCSVM
ncbi:F-box domain protein [Aspergillus undulatus]|uniref:F-box domain protein n=1 Tax=Aspergillus undulatus TaxID=1810928 RepID=UPI003CCE32E5